MDIKRISFISINDEKFDEMLKKIGSSERTAACKAVEGLGTPDEDMEFTYAYSHGALLVRIFDMGRYYFLFPIEVSEECNLSAALSELVRYCMYEEITPEFVDVPREAVELFFKNGYRHLDVDAASVDASSYKITLKNECMLLSEAPMVDDGEISLSSIESSDAEVYEKLIFDKENNKYWGYDYTDDYPDADGNFFAELSKREFEYSAAIVLGVKVGGILVGEASFHCFDFCGGADISIRILPEFQRMGYGRAALSLLFSVAADIGLTTLYARVHVENKGSMSLFSADADSESLCGETSVFTYSLYEFYE